MLKMHAIVGISEMQDIDYAIAIVTSIRKSIHIIFTAVTNINRSQPDGACMGPALEKTQRIHKTT